MVLKYTLIFDVDGTIIPLLVDFDSLREKIKRFLGVKEELKPLGLSLEKLQLDSALKARAWELIEEEEIDSIERLREEDYKGNVDLICDLHNSGFSIVLVTNRSHRSLELLLRKTGLNRCVDLTITREFSLDRRKQLESALKTVNGICLGFFGDTIYDETAARELGLRFRRVNSYKDLSVHVREILNTYGNS